MRKKQPQVIIKSNKDDLFSIIDEKWIEKLEQIFSFDDNDVIMALNHDPLPKQIDFDVQ